MVDASGCVGYTQATVANPTDIRVDVAPIDETKCKAFDEIQACITINGGVGPYTVALTTGTGLVPSIFNEGVETCCYRFSKR